MLKVITNLNEVDHRLILALPESCLRDKFFRFGLVKFWLLRKDLLDITKQQFPDYWVLLFDGVYHDRAEFWLARLNNLHPVVKDVWALKGTPSC